MKKIKVRIVLGLVIIIGVFALIFAYKSYEQAKRENELYQAIGEELANYSYVTNYELDGTYNDCLIVYVSNAFNDLDYAGIENFFNTIDTYFFEAHWDYMSNYSDLPDEDYLVSEKVICDSTIYTNQSDGQMLKDGEPFDQSSYYRLTFMERYELSDSELDMLSTIPYDTLNNILKIEDNDTCKREIAYQYGMAAYKSGDFSSAKVTFSDLVQYNYKNTYELLQQTQIMEKVQGTWQKDDENDYLQVIFDGWKMCISDDNIFGSNNYKYKSETGTASIENSDQIVFTPDGQYSLPAKFYLKGDKLYQIYADLSLQNECTKVSEDTTFPNIVALVEPYIGMTAEEVRTKSTWGNPEDINTTVTARTTYEQWCYPGYKYIYLENGIVTDIQK